LSRSELFPRKASPHKGVVGACRKQGWKCELEFINKSGLKFYADREIYIFKGKFIINGWVKMRFEFWESVSESQLNAAKVFFFFSIGFKFILHFFKLKIKKLK
jgi:hypothetical protein